MSTFPYHLRLGDAGYHHNRNAFISSDQTQTIWYSVPYWRNKVLSQ